MRLNDPKERRDLLRTIYLEQVERLAPELDADLLELVPLYRSAFGPFRIGEAVSPRFLRDLYPPAHLRSVGPETIANLAERSFLKFRDPVGCNPEKERILLEAFKSLTQKHCFITSEDRLDTPDGKGWIARALLRRLQALAANSPRRALLKCYQPIRYEPGPSWNFWKGEAGWDYLRESKSDFIRRAQRSFESYLSGYIEDTQTQARASGLTKEANKQTREELRTQIGWLVRWNYRRIRKEDYLEDADLGEAVAGGWVDLPELGSEIAEGAKFHAVAGALVSDWDEEGSWKHWRKKWKREGLPVRSAREHE